MIRVSIPILKDLYCHVPTLFTPFLFVPVSVFVCSAQFFKLFSESPRNRLSVDKRTNFVFTVKIFCDLRRCPGLQNGECIPPDKILLYVPMSSNGLALRFVHC